jgi:hypothetical protein
MMAKVARGEWAWALAVGVVAVALAGLPYLLGHILAPPDAVFSGVVMNFEDSHGYLAKMRQGAVGSFLYQVPFTPEDHAGAFMGGFYLALGWVAGSLRSPIEWVWHASRALFGLLLLLVGYRFIAAFLEEVVERRVAYLMMAFGSGLGWVFLLAGRFSLWGFDLIDFKMPEAHVFFTLATFPHFALGATLILASLLWALAYYRTGRIRHAILAGVMCLLMGVVHPYNILVVGLTLALYLGRLWIRRGRPPLREVLGTVAMVAIAAPSYIYMIYVFNTNPVFASWAEQAGSPSPHVLHYLIAYGPLLLLVIVGAPLLVRRGGNERWLPAIWMVATALLLYSPLKSQRRVVEGLQVPLSILASAGLCAGILPWVRRSRPFQAIAHSGLPNYSEENLGRFIIALVLLFMVPSNLYILGSLSVTALQSPYPFFHEAGEEEAMEWLRAQTEPSQTVLAAYETGSYIPARAGNRVFVGYWAETKDYPRKMEMALRFFAGDTGDAWRRELLDEYGVAYIFHGPRERELGKYDPASSGYLAPIFVNGVVTIYEVKEEAP